MESIATPLHSDTRIPIEKSFKKNYLKTHLKEFRKGEKVICIFF
jgi:hypothetical protein